MSQEEGKKEEHKLEFTPPIRPFPAFAGEGTQNGFHEMNGAIKARTEAVV